MPIVTPHTILKGESLVSHVHGTAPLILSDNEGKYYDVRELYLQQKKVGLNLQCANRKKW